MITNRPQSTGWLGRHPWWDSPRFWRVLFVVQSIALFVQTIKLAEVMRQ